MTTLTQTDEKLARLQAAGDLLQQIANGDDYHLPKANIKTRLKKTLGILNQDIPWRGNYVSYDSYLKDALKFFKKTFYQDMGFQDQTSGTQTITPQTSAAPQSKKLTEIIKRSLNKLNGINFFIHGSMARGDATDFSDVDDLVVFSEAAFEDFDVFNKNISELRRSAAGYQCIDPLQHHGHWVLTDTHLACGLWSKMPPNVLEAGCVHVCGEKAVTYGPLKQNNHTTEILRSNANDIILLSEKFQQSSLNANELKLLASATALLPALILSAQNKPTDKTQAIEKYLSDSPPFAKESLLWTATIRNDFGKIANIDLLRDQARKLYNMNLSRIEIYRQIINSPASLNRADIPDANTICNILVKFARWAMQQADTI